jgi:hypothetical protein
MVEHLLHYPKVGFESSYCHQHWETENRGGEVKGNTAKGSNTMVEHLPHHTKVEGLSPATAPVIGNQKIWKKQKDAHLGADPQQVDDVNVLSYHLHHIHLRDLKSLL